MQRKIFERSGKNETIKLWCGWIFLKGMMHEVIHGVDSEA